VTTPVHVCGGLAPPTVAIDPPWAPPAVVARADWPAPYLWPAPRIWAPPALVRSPWPAPVPALDAHAPPVDLRDAATYRLPRRLLGRGRSLAYTIAGVAAAAVSFAVVVIR
jgi:hypothetical protein